MTQAAIFTVHMPDVDVRGDIEAVFNQARAAAEQAEPDEDGLLRRQVIIITPGRLLISKQCPILNEIKKTEVDRLAQLIPSHPVRRIAVIAYTLLDALKVDIRQAIPFFDYLLGFGMLGHCVWVFEGHQSALTAGCRDADVLLVDDAMLPYLHPDWRMTALRTMRGSEIRLIAR